LIVIMAATASRSRVPTRFTAEQARNLVFSILDKDISSEDELTSDDSIAEENAEVSFHDTEDNGSSDSEDYQVENVTTSESEDEDGKNQGSRGRAVVRGQGRGRGVLGSRRRGHGGRGAGSDGNFEGDGRGRSGCEDVVEERGLMVEVMLKVYVD
jgi:hypothetical protein